MDLNIKKIQSEKKFNTESKNKFHALFTSGEKKKTSSEAKDSQEKSELSPISSKQGQNQNANYLNSLLKKSFYNTRNQIEVNSSINSTAVIQKNKTDIIADENSNSKLWYPKTKPQNFLPPFLFDNINVNKNKKIVRQTKNELRDVLDLYEKQKRNMKKYENEIIETKEELKKAKEGRNYGGSLSDKKRNRKFQ